MEEIKQTKVNNVNLSEEDQKKLKKKKAFKIAAIATGVAALGVASYCFYKSSKGSDGGLNIVDFPELDLPKISPEIQNLIDNKTGSTLTAERLGQKIGVSNREVNRRLIEKGLAERIGDSLYPTEAGKELGVFIDKTTRYGYSFSGLEWDECVANLIFTPEEFEAAAKRAEEVRKIMEGFSA